MTPEPTDVDVEGCCCCSCCYTWNTFLFSEELTNNRNTSVTKYQKISLVIMASSPDHLLLCIFFSECLFAPLINLCFKFVFQAKTNMTYHDTTHSGLSPVEQGSQTLNPYDTRNVRDKYIKSTLSN